MNRIKELAAIVSIKDSTPVAYLNVYEQGDLWIKTRGCADCSLTRKKSCCGNCPFLTDAGDCTWHETKGVSKKPFYCVVLPKPTACQPDCALEYECVKGSQQGKIRRVTDRAGVLV